MSRRWILHAGATVTSSVILPHWVGSASAVAPATATTALHIRSRQDWGADLPPTGPLDVEQPGDVRFLLVHHSASANDYETSGVAAQIRNFYHFHTGPSKGWHDVAYNFLVDRFGGVWEGRQGSMTQPVKGDATGGSQGYAILCCFIGNHELAPPSPEAQQAMVALLAWLADSYAIDTAPGTTTSFTSRGSNRWPAGVDVTTSTIAGHRDMSQTACPGDASYDLVKNTFPQLVTQARVVP